METQTKDKRKILWVLPLIVLPFLALLFYAMDGGKANTGSAQQPTEKGINTSLPDASLKKNEAQNKYGVYEQESRNGSGRDTNGIKNVADRLGFNGLEEDSQTKKINEKLQALNKELAQPAPTATPSTLKAYSAEPSGMKNDVERLEALMKNMKEEKSEDPEMAQLNGMLQKILDIQHPGQVQMRNAERLAQNPDSLFKATPAVIVDKQKAVPGATIKIRLQDSIRINGIFIPKGHVLYGICRITNQRLLLDIKNIRLGTSIIPVDLSVYSLDGMPGIYAPEAVLTDAVNSGASGAMGGIGFGGFDLASQVTGAGLDVAKSLFDKKVKRTKVKLEAGYAVLLRNNKPQTN